VANWLGKNSYSIFLVHFPVCLVVNAAFTRFMPDEAAWQALGTLLAWSASLAGGAAFSRWVEIPLGRMAGMAGSSRPPRTFDGMTRKDVTAREALR
jgi:peptidoglycan/LPS O-acetylase OafA/YrhL